MRTVATGKMNKFEALNKAEFIIELSAPLPTGVEAGYVIENLTCTPDAEIRNCHFGSCRARGLLVSTPGKVVIEMYLSVIMIFVILATLQFTNSARL